MRALGSFILRGYSQAMLVVLGSAVLAMLFPPTSLLSGAALALVTLRHGARYGAIVMLGSTAVVGGLAYFTLESIVAALPFLLILWLPLWVVAWVLRESRSLALATLTSGIFGVAGVVAVYIIVGDASAWWQAMLKEIFAPAIEAGGGLADPAEMEQALMQIADIMTGIAAAGLVLNTIMCLYLARAWQAILFNPGGFRTEFHELRLGRQLSIVTLLVVGLSLLPVGWLTQLADEVLLVLLSLYVIQGLALIHALVVKRKMHVAWLVVLYIVVFFLQPQLMVLVALAGFIDSWVDIRHRVPEKVV